MLRRLAPLLAALALLAGCAYAPRGLEGVPEGEGWVAFPLRGWLAEGRGRPEAMVACLSAACPHRLAVALITLSGDDAATTAQVLRDPERLGRYLRGRDRADTDPRRAAIRTQVAVRALREEGLPGFAITLSRADGARPPAYGGAVGRIEGDELRVVLAAGDDEAAVLAGLRGVVAARLAR
ncbi:hypothetical protein [Salinarimonas soli]|uniref:Lipoprotein n=1 Tax=Salinarimonas soli TaxID=1638099 RepID=A0A5B2VR36_9HYPH|nr:hypothetical protein [Salinarimonas soli]KAA2241264.1 hypothetical protein F0L46_04530 [Salinarimonas soli]